MAITFSTPEFRINTTINHSQNSASVTALATGGFVVTWETDEVGRDGGDAGAVIGQIFNAFGAVFGGEFVVNTTNAANQGSPSVTGTADGGFYVSFDDASLSADDPSSSAIRGQLFSASGMKSGVERLIPGFTADYQAYVHSTTLDDGRIVVVWEHGGADDPDDTSNTGIRFRILNPDGTLSGADRAVNVITTDAQYDPRVVPLTGGGFYVVWRDLSRSPDDPSDFAIRGVGFSSTGARVGSEWRINQETLGNQTAPDIARLADGRLIAVWTDRSGIGGDAFQGGIKARFLTDAGRPTGSEFLVNTTTTAAQDGAKVTALADGGFLVVWVDYSGTFGANSEILAQVFDSAGNRVGPETHVNTTTASFQSGLSVTTLRDGRVAVTWQDDSRSADDPGPSAVRGRILDTRTEAVRLAGTEMADQWLGTAFNDTMEGVGGNDSLHGVAGNDLLDGGAGNDSLFGGAGNDTYVVDAAGDLVIEVAGQGFDRVLASLSHTLATDVEALKLTGSGNLNGFGNAAGNAIAGNAGNNRLLGAAGADTLSGGGGNDTLGGGAGNDVGRGGGGDDRLLGRAGNDHLLGGGGNDRLLGGGGRDRLDGGGRNDTLSGGGGNDQLKGGAGRDRLGGGADRDRLDGGAGNDILIGGPGGDRLTGGRGADTFVFAKPADVGRLAGRDVITDFTSGQDRIDLSGVLRDGRFIGNASFTGTAGELRYGATDATLYGDIDGDGNDDFQIRLTGGPAILSTDFLF